MQGYRYFTCEVCGSTYKLATRDHCSPSGENCMVCQDFMRPEDSEPASGLPVDANGNLRFGN